MARVLGVQPESRELEDVHNCALLSPPNMGLGNIETVSVHQVTRSVFKDLFLKYISTSTGNGDGSFYNLYVGQDNIMHQPSSLLLLHYINKFEYRNEQSAYTNLFGQGCRLP